MATRRSRPPAPFAPTLALTVTLAVAAFAVVMPLVMTAVPGKALPAPFPEQHQNGETLSYLLAFAVILPAAIVGAERAASTIGGGPNRGALTALTGLLAAGLAAALVAVRAAGRLAGEDGVLVLLAAAAAWWILAGVLLARAARPTPWAPLPHAGVVWALAAAAVLGALLCFAYLRSISLPGVALGLVAAALATAAYGRVRVPRLPRRWGLLIDAVALAALLAGVPDLVIFRPEDAGGSLAVALQTGIIQFHHDFLLGPANEVLHGDPMLAGTASQYGVTSIYLLAGWFVLAPIGYGTLGFLTGVLTALWYGAGYAILRLGGTPRLPAVAALAVAVVALVLNVPYPVGSLPQSGPLRFGLPMAVVLAVVAGERFPRRAGGARVAAAAVVGLASVWALEAFVYTAAVFAALAAVQAWVERSARVLARQALAAVVACGVAHVVFAGATLAATGQLPDWGEYLAYVREFLFGDIGDLTYDVGRWTPALAVGAGYVASAAAVVELVRRRGPVVERERPALVAIAGVTAYGIVLLSYYVDRSQDHILIYVALPALLTGALWLALVLRAGDGAARPALAFALTVAALIVAVAWSSIGPRMPRSALAHAMPGGSSLRGALERLWDPPPLAPAAPAGVHALERYMPGERESLVMVSPDLGIEILLRSGRADRLSLGDPWEASFAGEDELAGLRKAVASLRPGDRMLMDEPARRVLAVLRAQPSRDTLRHPLPALASLQQWALQRLDRRFRLVTVARPGGGFTVVELRSRR